MMKTTKTNRPIALYILIAIFVLSLIPIYYVASYAHPSVDDYYYGAEGYAVYSQGGSFTDVIKSAASETLRTYNDWQGNFSAIFLMRMQPGVFGENAYILAPIILITAFIAGLFFLIYNVLRGIFKATGTTSAAVSLVITFCALQFTYVPSDSFYWYNGGIYYTFFFSLMCALLTLIISLLKARRNPGAIISGVIGIPLAFVIGGGNYSTALYLALILIFVLVYAVIQVRSRRLPIVRLAILLLMIATFFVSFILSVKAPGNAIRIAYVNYDSSIIKALMYSFAYGGYVIGDATTFPVIVLWVLLFPIFYRIARRTGFRFRLPLLVLLISFGVFCSQGTALFYAQGMRMPYRMSNIIYFNYYLFMTLNLLYLAGYLATRFPGSHFDSLMVNLTTTSRSLKIFAIVCSILFVIGCVGNVKVSENEEGGASFTSMPLSVSAARTIISGEGKIYDTELNERNTYLGSLRGNRDFITVPALTYTPEPIFHSDITTVSDDWKNMHLIKFYDLMSVKIGEDYNVSTSYEP